MRKLIKPAFMDPHNSVDLFDADRKNEFGDMYCVAPAILFREVNAYWKEYVAFHEYPHTINMNCKFCKGNSGRLNDAGVHSLCQARFDMGLDTPSLGNKCHKCNGSGTTGKGGSMLYLDLGPNSIDRALRAMFPRCTACNGKGKMP